MGAEEYELLVNTLDELRDLESKLNESKGDLKAIKDEKKAISKQLKSAKTLLLDLDYDNNLSEDENLSEARKKASDLISISDKKLITLNQGKKSLHAEIGVAKTEKAEYERKAKGPFPYSGLLFPIYLLLCLFLLVYILIPSNLPFECESGDYEIPIELLFDGNEDCPDGSDEKKSSSWFGTTKAEQHEIDNENDPIVAFVCCGLMMWFLGALLYGFLDEDSKKIANKKVQLQKNIETLQSKKKSTIGEITQIKDSREKAGQKENDIRNQLEEIRKIERNQKNQEVKLEEAKKRIQQIEHQIIETSSKISHLIPNSDLLPDYE